MRHARPEDLDRIEPLLEQVRALGGLKEKKRGCFYLKSKSFLHFHEDPKGMFADIGGGDGGGHELVHDAGIDLVDGAGALVEPVERLEAAGHHLGHGVDGRMPRRADEAPLRRSERFQCRLGNELGPGRPQSHHGDPGPSADDGSRRRRGLRQPAAGLMLIPGKETKGFTGTLARALGTKAGGGGVGTVTPRLAFHEP